MNKLTKSDILDLLKNNKNIIDIADTGGPDIDSLEILIDYKDLCFKIFTSTFCTEVCLYIIKVVGYHEDSLGGCRIFDIDSENESEIKYLNSRIDVFYKFYKDTPNSPLEIELFKGRFYIGSLWNEQNKRLCFKFEHYDRPHIYLAISKGYLILPDDIICRVDISLRYSRVEEWDFFSTRMEISLDHCSYSTKLAYDFSEFLSNSNTFYSVPVSGFRFDDIDGSMRILINTLISYLLQVPQLDDKICIKYTDIVEKLQGLLEEEK